MYADDLLLTAMNPESSLTYALFIMEQFENGQALILFLKPDDSKELIEFFFSAMA